MPFRGTNAEAGQQSNTGTPRFLGFQEVALTDVVDKSDKYPNMDLMIDLYFRNSNSEYPYIYTLMGTFNKDGQGNIVGDDSLLKRVLYLCDALGFSGGVDKEGNWVDADDKKIDDIAGYLNLNYADTSYNPEKDKGEEKYYIFVYKKFVEKSNKAYTTVCPKIVKNETGEKLDLQSYVEWMKNNKFIVEHDESASKSVNVDVATAEGQSTFAKF
tara:strand:- start:91 stop:732 length:642 start_codon:yes stop_codon:yes gene_type:complete